MEWFALLIPIILGFIVWVIWKHKIHVIEFVVPIVVAIITIAIMKAIMVNSRTSDVEYLSEYVVSAEYYEDWDEWISQTCSYECCCDSKGENCKTVYYDCSYRDYHSEYYQVTMNTGRVHYISKAEYYRLKILFNNESFVDLHRDYYTKDGDKYVTYFDGDPSHIQSRTWVEYYENRTQAAYTVFKFEELDSSVIKQLYEYPEIIRNDQATCLGCNQRETLLLKQYNGLLGHRYEVHVFVIIFDGKDVGIAEKQRQFWKNGNKNELIICMDRDKQWVRTFSWCDDKQIEVECNNLFLLKDKTLEYKIKKLNEVIPKYWKRKHFEDFSYIEVPLTPTQEVWLFLVVTIVTVIGLAIGIGNDFDATN